MGLLEFVARERLSLARSTAWLRFRPIAFRFGEVIPEVGKVIVRPRTGPPVVMANPATFIASFSATLTARSIRWVDHYVSFSIWHDDQLRTLDRSQIRPETHT